MTGWNYLEWAAWIGAALLVIWMLWDAIRVSRHYSEDVLTSSQEGFDELLQHQNHSKG